MPESNIQTASPPAKPSGLHLWIQRLKLVIEVIFFVELGMLLVVLPWSPFWTQNSLLGGYSQIRALVEHGFIRGVFSGLGLINIWIGVADAVRYKE